jgi:hypothetical protein
MTAVYVGACGVGGLSIGSKEIELNKLKLKVALKSLGIGLRILSGFLREVLDILLNGPI